MSHAYTTLANRVAATAGLRGTAVLLPLLLVGWGIGGYLTGIPDAWWWLAGTATGVVSCVMMFVVQDTQRRNSAAVHRRLDELLRVVNDAQHLAGVESNVNRSRQEPAPLQVGASSEVTTIRSLQRGAMPRHVWLVPAPGRHEHVELTPGGGKPHDAEARLTETSTRDV
jgi:low affinity Fe/Cu permease